MQRFLWQICHDKGGKTIEMTTNQRVAAILEDKEISNTKFAKLLQMEPSTVIRQVAGRSAMSAELLTKMLMVSEFADVSAEYILRGVGPMYNIPMDEEMVKAKTEMDSLRRENETLRSSVVNLIIELTEYRNGKK